MAKATSGPTKVKGVEEALAAVKSGGGKKKRRSTTKKKTPAKKKASAKKKTPAKKAKAKASAKKKTPAKKAKASDAKKSTSPSSGQGGPSLDLPVDQISAKEMRVVEVLDGAGSGTREIWTIAELAAECFKSQSKKKGNSWVRNSLRRLVRGNVVEKVERGQFRISDAGRKKLARAEAA